MKPLDEKKTLSEMLILIRIIPHVPAHPSHYLIKSVAVTAVADPIFYFKTLKRLAMSDFDRASLIKAFHQVESCSAA